MPLAIQRALSKAKGGGLEAGKNLGRRKQEKPNSEESGGRIEQLGTRGDRHSSRVEAKNPALLSSRDGYLLELTGWTQGSQAS